MKQDGHKTRRVKRAKEIQRQIRSVLLNDFDPIAGAPEDEYDSLIGPVYSLLHRRASREEIVQWLLNVQSDFGGGKTLAELRVVASKLEGIDVDLA